AGTGKTRAVHESRESDAALLREVTVARVVFTRKLFALRVVFTELKRARQQVVHVDAFANHLAGRGGFAFVNEVATTKFFRTQSDRLSNFIHVPFEREDALRGAKSPKGAVGRNVRCDRATVNPDVGTDIWTSSMDRSSRKHDRRQCAISAAIDDEVDLHREQFAVLRHRGFVTRARGM